MSKAHKIILVLITFWTFVNAYTLMIAPENSSVYCARRDFGDRCLEWAGYTLIKENSFLFINTIDIDYYDFTEFFIFVGISWIFYGIYLMFFKKRNIRKSKNASSNTTQKDRIELLKDLSELKEKGLITDEEFKIEKERLFS
jgi:uncharacterized membrane protein